MTTPHIRTKPRKSIWFAVLLAFLLGPLGLFYASITGGIILTLIVPVFLSLVMILGESYEIPMLIVTGALGLSLIFFGGYWLIAMIWAFFSVTNYNREIDREEQRQLEFIMSLQQSNAPPINVNIQHSPAPPQAGYESKTDQKLNLQEWLRNNPEKTINDYYVKFGKY